MAVSLNGTPPLPNFNENLQGAQQAPEQEIFEEQTEAEREAERARGLESLNRMGRLLQQSGNRKRIEEGLKNLHGGGGHKVIQLAGSPKSSDTEPEDEVSEADTESGSDHEQSVRHGIGSRESSDTEPEDEVSESNTESDSDHAQPVRREAPAPNAAREQANRGEPGRRVRVISCDDTFVHGAVNGILGGIVGSVTAIFLKNIPIVGGFLVGGVLVAVMVLSRRSLEIMGGGVSRTQSVACSILVALSVAILIPVLAEYTITYGATLTIGTIAIIVREAAVAILIHTIS